MLYICDMKISRNYSKKIGIYCIYNRKNRKIYIGSSINIYTRLHKHLSQFKAKNHQNIYLRNSINKYKIEDFTCFILEECLQENFLQKEQYWINVLKPEYNLTKEVLRNTLSIESRKKVSETLKLGYKNGTIKFTRTRKIDVYTTSGVYKKSFNNIREASRKLNISASSIHRMLNGTYKQTNGYRFKYSENKKILKKIKVTANGKAKKGYTKGKKIIVLILEINRKKTFDSITHCAKYLNIKPEAIVQCLRGKNKIYKKRFSFSLPR